MWHVLLFVLAVPALVSANQERQGLVALERLYEAKHDPDMVLEIARLYDARAESGGDPRDARLAMLYYELAAKGAAVDAAIQRLRPRAEATTSASVPVSFTAYRGRERYRVSVGELSCTTPCALDLPPGPTRAHATGAGVVDLQLVVPRVPSQVRLQSDPSSRYTTAGAVLLPVGAMITATLWATGLVCGNLRGCALASIIAWPLIGGATFFTGIGLLAAGGARRPAADANRPEILEARRKPRVRLIGVALVPSASGASTGAGFSF